MAIVSGLFWIIVGIAYIIYKGFKEEKEITTSVLKYIGIVSAWAYIPWLISYFLFGEDIATIVSLVTFGIPVFILAIYGIISNLK